MGGRLIMSMRIIWVVIRGQNYAGQALKEAGKQVDELKKKQQQLAQQARYMMFSGLLMVAMAAMVAMALGKLIEKTSLGALYMADFGTAIEKLMTSAGEAITKEWGPAIEAFLGWLDKLAEDETFKMIIGQTAVPLMLTIGLIGISMVVSGLLATFFSMLLPALIGAGVVPAGTTISASTFFLPLTIALVITLLWVFAEPIGDWINENIATPVSNALDNIKEEITIGAKKGDWLSMIIDAFGQWFYPEGTYGSWTGKQQGTRFIPKTGPYYLHEGEKVIPSTGDVGGLGVGVGGAGNYFDVRVAVEIGEVHTEADEDRLAIRVGEKIAKSITDRLG